MSSVDDTPLPSKYMCKHMGWRCTFCAKPEGTHQIAGNRHVHCANPPPLRADMSISASTFASTSASTFASASVCASPYVGSCMSAAEEDRDPQVASDTGSVDCRRADEWLCAFCAKSEGFGPVEANLHVKCAAEIAWAGRNHSA